jgi:hypothetical protein
MWLLLRTGTVQMILAALQNRISQTKSVERRTKRTSASGSERSPGKARNQASARPAMLQTAPLACKRKAT